MGRKLTKEEFIKRAIDKHGSFYNYDKVVYTNNLSKVVIICPLHGEFEQMASKHLNGNKCRKCGIDDIHKGRRLDNDTFIKLAIEKHGNKFDYSKINVKGEKTKIKIICHKHGEFEQSPRQHLDAEEPCKKCRVNHFKHDLEKFTKLATLKHDGIYNYSLVEYEQSNKHINIICPIHGTFKQLPYKHLSGQGCSKCISTKVSKIEKLLIDEFDIDFIENDRSILEGKEIDLLYKNIGIEVNGIYWHSEKFYNRKYHLDKSKLAESKGIQLLHFWDYEIDLKLDLVKSMINSKLGLSNNKIYARKCSIKEITFTEAKEFLGSNHLQGSGAVGKIRLGLYYNDILVSIMTFAKPRFNKNYDYELIRFCNLINYSVVGGASKLLSYFRKNYKGSIISYANRRFSNGNLYETLGFKLVNETEPSYFYAKGYNILSRNQCQKHKLKDILKDFDNNLSEHENMLKNKYYRVYDCVNLVYVME